MLAAALCLLLPAGLAAQNRDVRSGRIILDDNNGRAVTIQPPTTGGATSWTFTLPAAAPSAAGQALTSDGAGGFSWQTPSGGGGGSIPAGFMIVGTGSTAPTGYTAAGTIEQNGAWTPKASQLTLRTTAAAAEAGGKIYVMGGADNSGNTMATMEEYDPATNTWSSKASMTTARTALAAAGAGGKVYAIGGRNAAGNAVLTTTEEYDPATNTWSTKAAMTTARREMTAVTVGGKIYAIGGRTNASGASVHTAANEEYNPETNTWTAKTAAPEALRDAGLGTYNNRLYVFGGTGSSGVLAGTREYDPSTNAWTSKAPIPIAQADLAGATLNGLIYLVGNGGAHYRYDPVGNSWTVLTEAPGAFLLHSGGYFAIGGSLYAVGPNLATLQFTPPTTLYLYSKN